MKKIVPLESYLVPYQAKCVFKGEIFDVYQWQQSMFDGTNQTFEMLKRTDASNALAIHDGKIVILKQLQPHWKKPRYTLPGGRGDKGEDSLRTAKRELLEETGMSFKNWKLFNVVQIHEKIEYFIYTYLATELQNQVGTEHDAGEKIEIKLLSLEEIHKIMEDEPRLRLSRLDRFSTIEDLIIAPEFEGREVETNDQIKYY